MRQVCNKHSYEIERTRAAFFNALSTICCSKMAGFITRHYFNRQAAKTMPERKVVWICDQLLRQVLA